MRWIHPKIIEKCVCNNKYKICKYKIYKYKENNRFINEDSVYVC